MKKKARTIKNTEEIRDIEPLFAAIQEVITCHERDSADWSSYEINEYGHLACIENLKRRLNDYKVVGVKK